MPPSANSSALARRQSSSTCLARPSRRSSRPRASTAGSSTGCSSGRSLPIPMGASHRVGSLRRIIRSIRRAMRFDRSRPMMKAELLRGFGTAARAARATHLKGLPRNDELAATAATRPFQIVEFDGHRLDIRLKVVIHDPLGFTHEFEIERVWLLVIIDVCTRAVLGYHLVLAREYSRYDVIKTVEAALEPHRTRSFTIPELAYGPMSSARSASRVVGPEGKSALVRVLRRTGGAD